MNPIHIAAGSGRKLNVLGHPIILLLRGSDTAGALGMVETVDAPGYGPPPHTHRREDETFQVLEGEYEFTCAGKTLKAGQGSTLFAPRGVPHSYKCISQSPGRMVVALTPAGFEGFFEEIDALGAAQQDIPQVIAIGQKYGMEIHPPLA